MTRRKRLAQAADAFGRPPDLLYFPGDMTSARSYFDHGRGAEAFSLDDATWDDLDLDRVFQRINLGLSNAGEQYLYYLLRTPALHSEEFARRRARIFLMEERPTLRRKLHTAFARLGRRSHVDIWGLFTLTQASAGRLALYLSLSLGLLLSIALLASTPSAAAFFLVLGLCGFNSLLRHQRLARDAGPIHTVQYCAAMVSTLRALVRLGDGDLNPYLEEALPALGRLARLRGSPGAALDEVGELLNSFFLLDLIQFERDRRRLVRREEDFIAVHRCLGALDAALSVASWRQSLPFYTDPELDFSAAAPYVRVEGLVHPLVAGCVPNDLTMEGSLLLTGSNASGKTTFLRSLALNVILAQSVCTALAARLSASPLRVLTSIAVSDSLADGESYYLAELLALRRVLDAVRAPGAPVLCCLDEIFRGTNAVERIAASAEVLDDLGRRCLCAAATHDLELCAILSHFALYHFEEQLEGGEMTFDYRLRPGYSTTSNAIRLLSLTGFPPEVAARAEARAEAYLRRGRWDAPAPTDTP